MASAAQRIASVTGNRRGQFRADLGRPGVVRTADGAVIDVFIRDLTREGCRIATDAVLEPDEAISIGIAGVGSTPARTVWRNEIGYGCAFDQTLLPGAVTKAFAGPNVALFPQVGDPVAATDTGIVKWSGRARVGIITAAALGSWTALVALVMLLI